MNIQDCLKKGFLKKCTPDNELCQKELNEAMYDLERAEDTYMEKDYKWTIIKCYYCMFHAAKALLFSMGYIEKKHLAIVIVLEELNKQGKIEQKHITNFKASMSAREEADYNYTYSEEIAEHELSIAKDFIEAIKKRVQ